MFTLMTSKQKAFFSDNCDSTEHQDLDEAKGVQKQVIYL